MRTRAYVLINCTKKEKNFYSEMNIDKNKRIGLTDEQVRQSREQHGKNVLTPPQRTSLWKLYLDKYRDPIIQILLVAAVPCKFSRLILAYELIDSFVGYAYAILCQCPGARLLHQGGPFQHKESVQLKVLHQVLFRFCQEE